MNVCLHVCMYVCVSVRSINLCTEFSLNARTLSGLRAEWLWEALVKPCPTQVLSSAAPGELPHWADVWA